MAFALEQIVVNLVGDTANFNAAFTRASRVLDGFSSVLTRTGLAITAGLGVPTVIAVRQSIKAFSDFDSAMTQSTAIILNMNDSIRESMERLALTISSRSIKSARDLAQGYFFLASAGMSAQEAMANLELVTQFAQAGMFSMAKATDLATDAFSALGMKTGSAAEQAEKLRHVTDTLVEANTLANATVEQFSLALTTRAGAAMKSYNIELEEGVAVLAAMADQGTKAQRAGTEFDRLLRLLTKASISSKEEWQQLGFTIFNSQGDLLNMADIIENIEVQMAGLSSQQKVARLDMMGFEARVQQVILPLLGTSDAIRKYQQEMEQMSDTTRKVSDEQLKSFASQLTIVKNKIDELKIQIGTMLGPVMIRLAEIIGTVVEWIIALPAWVKWSVFVFTLLAIAAGVVMIVLGALIGVIAGIVAALAALAVIVSTSAFWMPLLTAAVAAAWAAFQIFVIGVGLAVAALMLLYKGYQLLLSILPGYNEETKQQVGNLAKQGTMLKNWTKNQKDYIDGLEKGAKAAKTNKEKLAAYNEAIKKGTKQLNQQKNTLDAMIEKEKKMASAGQQSSKEYMHLVMQMEAYAEVVAHTEKTLERYKQEAQKINTTMQNQAKTNLEAKEAVADLEKDLKKQIDTFGMSSNEVKLYELKMKGATDAQLAQAKAMMLMLHLAEKGKEARENQRRAATELRDDANSMIESMQREAAVFLIGEDAVKRNELAQRGLSQAKIDEIRQQQKLIAGLKEEQKLRNKAAKIIEKYKTAEDKILEKADELNKMQTRGLIDANMAEKEMEKFIKQVEKDSQINIKTNILGPEAMEAGSIKALQAATQRRMNATQVRAAAQGRGVTAGKNAKEVLDYQKQTATATQQMLQRGTILLPAALAGMGGN